MTEFFKTNPIAVRHCILYEYLRKNPVKRSFIALCKTVGPDVIKEEEFHLLFNQFSQGIFDEKDDKKPITDMRDVLRNDKYALRVCILYESIKCRLAESGSSTHFLWPNSKLSFYEIQSNPSFAMYNNFCKVIGDDVMVFPEFDFWFHRFSNGDVDCYQTEEYMKIHELTDIPLDIMTNIVEYLDIYERINLAKTSRSLRAFAKNQKLFHHSMKLRISHHAATISFGKSVDIEYYQNGDDCVKHYKKRETFVQGVAYWKQAILDFKSILKNPKIYVDFFEIELNEDHKYVLNDLKNELKLTHPLNVKNLILNEQSWELLPISLPMLKPGYLTTIDISSYTANVDPLEIVFKMEQWKRAKRFYMEGSFIWPLHHLYHFEVFHVILEKWPVEDIRQMKKTLFKSPSFEKCIIWDLSDTGANVIEEEFGDFTWQDQNVPESTKIYHYPIPNSTEYFEINNYEFEFEITRKKI